ncbi:MAG TPA: hypothetical protein PKA20_30535 [Burkholderiaceae bacterium]|nr:hypothetical protein [Burkholderiaceae bacterium]
MAIVMAGCRASGSGDGMSDAKYGAAVTGAGPPMAAAAKPARHFIVQPAITV